MMNLANMRSLASLFVPMDAIVQRGTAINVLREICTDASTSPVLQFQDERGRILLSVSIPHSEVLAAAQQDSHPFGAFDLAINTIRDGVAVHSSFGRFFHDKIVSSSSWNTFW